MIKKGFTLVELLVVIAIIGILSSVAVVNLNSARNKAKISAVKTQLNSVIPLIQLCYSFDNEILYNGIGECIDFENKVVAGTKICDSVVDTWPTLVEGYTYLACDSNMEAFNFFIGAEYIDSGLKNISCTENSLGCVEVD